MPAVERCRRRGRLLYDVTPCGDVGRKNDERGTDHHDSLSEDRIGQYPPVQSTEQSIGLTAGCHLDMWQSTGHFDHLLQPLAVRHDEATLAHRQLLLQFV